jgi:hypothetical protein
MWREGYTCIWKIYLEQGIYYLWNSSVRGQPVYVIPQCRQAKWTSSACPTHSASRTLACRSIGPQHLRHTSRLASVRVCIPISLSMFLLFHVRSIHYHFTHYFISSFLSLCIHVYPSFVSSRQSLLILPTLRPCRSSFHYLPSHGSHSFLFRSPARYVYTLCSDCEIVIYWFSDPPLGFPK